MGRWHIQYIYQDGAGDVRMSEEVVVAETREQAAELAVRYRPTTECVFSVHPESDEQFLNAVRTQALGHAGKKWTPEGD